MCRTHRRREASPACCGRGQMKSGGEAAAAPLVSAFLLLLSRQNRQGVVSNSYLFSPESEWNELVKETYVTSEAMAARNDTRHG